MLHPDYLQELVDIGGRALEHEDRFIAGCTSMNRNLYSDNRPGGILRIKQERYYQFVIARALMSNYRYGIDIEKERYDFVLSGGNEREWLAVGELKTWLSTNGKQELPGMKSDIEKLRRAQCPAFFLVATAWAPDEAEYWIGQLTSELVLPASQRVKEYRFQTIGWHPDRERQFALLGYSVA